METTSTGPRAPGRRSSARASAVVLLPTATPPAIPTTVGRPVIESATDGPGDGLVAIDGHGAGSYVVTAGGGW